MPRLTRDEYGLQLAQAAAARADCSRRQVGAVIVSEDGSVVSTGYNGLAAGRPGCASEGACPRGRMSYADQPADVAYEATGCRAIHAEVNAIIRAGMARCAGATIYVTDEPCFHCAVVIEGAKLARVVFPSGGKIRDVTPAEVPLQRPTAVVDVPVVIGDAAPVVGKVTEGVLVLTSTPATETPTVERATSGPLDPEIHAALVRQEARIQAHRDAAAVRAELALTHPGWRTTP